MSDAADAAFMRRALRLARLGLGRVHPNPMVGAVVVRDGNVVGEGYHAEFGGAHAEVNALHDAGEAAAGATLYVTLEPCAHHGKTPPCTSAIIAAGIRRVVHATDDPNVQARGGAAVLRAAGIEVQGHIEEDAARALNAVFFHAHTQQTPYVALKLAMSLDARIAAAHGVRTQLTGSAATEEVHRLRASHDAVLVGSATALIDDPLLTVRAVPATHRPIRIVLDTTARLPVGSALVRSIGDAPLWLVCAPDAPADRVHALSDAGVTMMHCERSAQGIDIAAALRLLYDQGVRSVLAEGGAALAASLIRTQRLHRIYLFVAPTVLGHAGVPAFSHPFASAWHTIGAEQFAESVLITLAPRSGAH